MSTVNGRVINTRILGDTNWSAFTGEGTAADTAVPLKLAVIQVDHNALAVAAGDTISVSPTTATQGIQNAVKNGKTATMRYACCISNAFTVGVAGVGDAETKSLTAKTITITAGGITTFTFIPAEEDYTTTTDGDIAAAVILNRPFEFLIAYSES